jgi:hypothetical protein
MKITDTHIYFWDGIYSNWHPCQLTDHQTNLKFENTEQAFMWYKAVCFNDTEIQKQVEKTPSPKAVKMLGRQIKSYDDAIWSKVRFEKMVYVNMLKFSQNSEFKNELLETKNKILVEASPYDKVWGVGLGENDALILDSANWNGLNLLGEALMTVRQMVSK